MPTNPNIFLVIPTVRDVSFLSDWADQLSAIVGIIICEDRKTKSKNLIPPNLQLTFHNLTHYSWHEIDKDLGKQAWIVPRKVSGIRNYGFLQAHKMGADIIVTLDDDCYPLNQESKKTREQKNNKTTDHSQLITDQHKKVSPFSRPARSATDVAGGETDGASQPESFNHGTMKPYSHDLPTYNLPPTSYYLDNCFLQHAQNLSLTTPARWTNTNPDIRHLYTRGMPYLNRSEQPVMLSHGLWTNVLDHDAPTHLQHLNFRAEFAQHFLQIIPNRVYFPMCSMNLAFRREITPLMYFPLMSEDNKGNKWGYYNRFDDIWAGLFAKKIMDHLGYGVVNGAPFVEHRKASNVFTNLKNEAAGIEKNEILWQLVDVVNLTQATPKDCYIELAKKIKFPKEEYFEKLREAMIIWAKMF